MTSDPRNERGASGGGVVSSIVVVLALIVVMRLLFDTDPIRWLDAAADWCVDAIRDIVHDLGGSDPSLRH